MVYGDDKENKKAELKRKQEIKRNQEEQSAREMFKIIQEISDLLGTNLDAETLRYCIRLCEGGINPEILATIVLELQNEVRHHKNTQRFVKSNENGTA